MIGHCTTEIKTDFLDIPSKFIRKYIGLKIKAELDTVPFPGGQVKFCLLPEIGIAAVAGLLHQPKIWGWISTQRCYQSEVTTINRYFHIATVIDRFNLVEMFHDHPDFGFSGKVKNR